MAPIRSKEADSLNARRKREKELVRELDEEATDALLEHRVLVEQASREVQRPEPKVDPACVLHPSWDPRRFPGQPKPPASMCPECLRAHAAEANPPRPEPVEVDPYRTTASQDRALAKHQERLAANDPEPERPSSAWDAWWVRERQRRSGILLDDPFSTAEQVEADALARINQLREIEMAELQRRPGGARKVYQPIFGGGYDSPDDRTLWRR
jgi:hypothetical protein